jgi:hypothetical protein
MPDDFKNLKSLGEPWFRPNLSNQPKALSPVQFCWAFPLTISSCTNLFAQNRKNSDCITLR